MQNRRTLSALFHCALYFSAGIIACSSSDASFEDGGGALAQVPVSAAGAAGADGGAHDPEHGPSDAEPAEASQPVRLRFRAAVGAEAFACGKTYVSSAGVSFTPADLRLFVQDLALIGSEGDEHAITLDVSAPWQLEDVALLDFEDGSGACLAGTRELNLEVHGRVTRGEYHGLAFTNGVPEAENHADPTRLPPPLQAGSMSWGWLLGYRFLMAEVASAGTDAGLPGSALLHLGSTACSGSPNAGGISCAKPNRNRIRLDDFDADTDEVVVDLAALFDGMDLTRITTCHSSGDECAPFFGRVGLNLADGSAIDGQSLYRVEAARTVAP